MENALIRVIKCDDTGKEFTAKSFLEKLRMSNNFWWQNNKVKECNWVFRGQWDSDWPLLPPAWRKKNDKFEPLIKKISLLPNNTEKDIKQIQPEELEYYITLNAEYQAQYDFFMLADNLGFQIEQGSPGPIQNNKILPYDADGIISKNIYLSQHHGIPTRLIDWTRNSIVASYFAIGREMRPNFESEQICVWACDTGKIPFFRINGIVKEKNGFAPAVEMGLRFYNVPNYQSKYLYSQQGLFSGITGKGIKEFFIQNNRFPSIEDLLMLNNDITEPLFFKFVLSRKHVDELLLLLDRENVSQAHLMPTLDKVTETVISRWSY